MPRLPMTVLISFLRRVRRREQHRLVLLSGLWLVAGGLIAYGTRFLGGGQTTSDLASWRPLPSLAPTAILLSIAIAFLLRATVCAPSLSRMAAVADDRAGLMDRLSTAVEVSSVGPKTVVEELLVADSIEVIANVRPERIVRLLPGRGALLWLVAACVLVACANWGVVAAQRQRTVAAEPSLPTPLSIAESSLSLAALLNEDPRFEDDPYLEAIARSFEELSASARSATSVSGELETELAELLGHLYDALEGRDPVVRDVLQDQLSGLFSEPGDEAALRSPSASSTAGELPPEAGGMPLAPTPELGQADSLRPAAGSDRLQRALDAVVESLQESKSAREERQGPDRAAVPSDVVNSYEFLTPEMQAAIELAQATEEEAFETAADGVTIGAASDANDGGGNQAGDGIQPMLRNNEKPVPELAAGAQELLLPDGDRDGGAQRRAETMPISNGETGIRPVSIESLTWEPLQLAHSSESTLVGLRHRDLVSRYFMPGDR